MSVTDSIQNSAKAGAMSETSQATALLEDALRVGHKVISEQFTHIDLETEGRGGDGENDCHPTFVSEHSWCLA